MAHQSDLPVAVNGQAVVDLGRLLAGLENFLIRAENVINALHTMAKSVESMEADGSLYTLLELWEELEDTARDSKDFP